MKLTQHTTESPSKIVLTNIVPSRRYLIGGDVASMPTELARRKIAGDVVDAHAKDVSATLDGMASSAKRLTSTSLTIEQILLGADRISREMLNGSD